MKLRIERRGGLAGLKAVGERDLDELSPEQRQALDQLMQSPSDQPPSPGADRFMYTVELRNDDGSSRARLRIPEERMPDLLASISKVTI